MQASTRTAETSFPSRLKRAFCIRSVTLLRYAFLPARSAVVTNVTSPPFFILLCSSHSLLFTETRIMSSEKSFWYSSASSRYCVPFAYVFSLPQILTVIYSPSIFLPTQSSMETPSAAPQSLRPHSFAPDILSYM